MKVFDKLQIKIKADTGLDLYDFKRTNAGRHGLCAGAFSWVADRRDTGRAVGSGVTATELLKQDKIHILDNVTDGNMELG